MKTVDQFVEMICANVKTNRWLSCTETVQRSDGQCFSVGVKSYGRWVQVMECGAYRDGLPEQKTIKALRDRAQKLVTALLNAQGA